MSDRITPPACTCPEWFPRPIPAVHQKGCPAAPPAGILTKEQMEQAADRARGNLGSAQPMEAEVPPADTGQPVGVNEFTTFAATVEYGPPADESHYAVGTLAERHPGALKDCEHCRLEPADDVPPVLWQPIPASPADDLDALLETLDGLNEEGYPHSGRAAAAIRALLVKLDDRCPYYVGECKDALDATRRDLDAARAEVAGLHRKLLDVDESESVELREAQAKVERLRDALDRTREQVCDCHDKLPEVRAEVERLKGVTCRAQQAAMDVIAERDAAQAQHADAERELNKAWQERDTARAEVEQRKDWVDPDTHKLSLLNQKDQRQRAERAEALARELMEALVLVEQSPPVPSLNVDALMVGLEAILRTRAALARAKEGSNQCDGCLAQRRTERRGDLILHYMGDSNYSDLMICQKDKYE